MDQARTTSQLIVFVVAALLLVALGYTVHVIISPFVLLGAVLYVLFPFREEVLARRMMWLSGALFTLWFAYSLLGLLAPFIASFILAYVLNPLVVRLRARGVPRWASSLVIVVLLIAVALAVAVFVIPPAAKQFQGIISGMTVMAQNVSEVLKSGKLFDLLSSYGLEVQDVQQFISTQLSPRLEQLLTSLFEGVFGVVTGVSSLVLHLINIIIIPFLLFYMLKDFPFMLERCAGYIPENSRMRVNAVARTTDDILGKYFRGAIVVAIIQGTIATVGLTIIGVRYALVLGIMTGILDFIPYVGLLVSLTVSCIVALLSGDPVLAKVVAVIVLFLSQKLLEATVLAPKIIGSNVGLHPVLLILSLLVFGYFLGFVGMLIAVPTTALLMTALAEWERKRGILPEIPV